ncbi:hypothetical protein PYW08_006194 [Mythimna loreyi]|uniref:Uncharacterized protein n=1 Tax=Mythimna loreyi TaxID=667449 RepID=A0ACC2QM02_9NEOP|nr:hypothetical protein PYW08_006194 [Mythimna loreyi]
MESGITNDSEPADEGPRNVMNTDSADSFQSFIYELFEKNGILNDLRAYLRGHIVNVLKSAETGDPPPCQKNFTQRLDLRYQALNMLVAEYLMRLEFNYSFSIFVSEIPLANMVFGFAKSLMENIDENTADMRFKDSDVWSILNYLGIQCDSERASNIVEMYQNEKENPLLLCILKAMPMYNKEGVVDPRQNGLSEISVATSKSLESMETIPTQMNKCMPECSHFSYCKKCQNNTYKIKDEYKRKKKYLAKEFKNKESSTISPLRSESLVKNINVMEKTLIDEMFQQLKSVYESEVEMVKTQEEKKVKRSLATHAIQLQQKRNELEETFKVREEELERSIQHKKKFLWGLARSLREQHAHMTRAMHDVRAETERLEFKENSLKTQLIEAEEILKQRGEDMRLQITRELATLESHLESMKRERENITRERSELENLKIVQDTNVKVNKTHKIEAEEARSHYNLLKNELAILRSYLESSQMQPKCVIERGTITEPMESASELNMALNNTQGNEKASKSDDFDERVKMNQVINDFRKKNVNFSQSNLDEIYHERSRDRSRSENSSEAGDIAVPDLDLERGLENDLIQRLRDDNERLKAFARQIMSPQRPPRVSACPRCAAPDPRPRTAPATEPPANNGHMFNFNNSASASTLNVGWRKGAGEELSMFSNAQPRILVPGDTLPFIGVLHDKHGNARRAAAGGSRSHARAALAGVSKRLTSPYRDKHAPVAGSSGQGARVSSAHMTAASCSAQPDDDALPTSSERGQQRPRPKLSSKPLLKEPKEKLRRQDNNKESAESCRDASPSVVLREAKLRLRKLEIEADAVEQSYRDYRRRQSQLRLQREQPPPRDNSADTHQVLDVTQSHSTQQVDETTKTAIEAQFEDLQKTVRGDFDKYIREYKTKFDIGETHFKSKPTVADRVTPIPGAYAADGRGNYIETPLNDFRKLYTSARQPRRDDTEDKPLARTVLSDESKTEFDYEHSARHDALRKVKHDKKAELQILKQNISQMYHLPDNDLASAATVPKVVNQSHPASTEEQNLRVEVERYSEVNTIKSQTQDMLLVVQSSVNSRDVTIGNEPSGVFAAQMTIIVSPQRGASAAPDERRRSQSPEQAARLTRNDVLDAIFHADPNTDASSVHMQLELAKDDDDATSDYEKDDFPADFSADRGRYSPSEDERSPISVPAMDDDNFWET